jgi:1-acyl-sn-glycerol-3-phosphate acyltransferase
MGAVKTAARMDLLYRISCLAGRFAFFCTMRAHVINARQAERKGGYILALTHLSHLDPMCASVLSQRRIDWMTRKEFFRYRAVGRYLRACNAFLVNRQGIPVSSIRTAIERARRGRAIGICPEGGVTQGRAAAIRGGRIKRGCCSVALRSGMPIVPCVMLGTDKLNRVGPWLPFKRAEIWVAYGPPIYPPAGTKSTRANRDALSATLVAAFGQLYAELREKYGICDSMVP